MAAPPAARPQREVDGRGRLIVFAKAPRAGSVKTRMCPPLSPEQAADLYSHMLEDVVEATAGFGAALGLEVVLAVHPPDACEGFTSRLPNNVAVVAQRGVDLADRMAFAILEAAATGTQRILVRGSDSPVLGFDVVEAALHALDDADVAISPDLGGGYGLIALRAPTASLFEHPMSTRTVLDETLESAERAGLRVQVLAPRFDLDTAEDLGQLEAARRAGDTELCPRTVAYLDAERLWASSEPRYRR